MSTTTDKAELFERTPVPKAVVSLVFPTILSQITTVIYNMVDGFFIGQIGDPHQMAAVTLSMPLFFTFTGIANLFGIGGASLISRSLGRKDPERATRCAAFSIWTAGSISFIYGILVFLLRPVIFPFLGTDASTYGYCSDYVFWAITVGALPTVMSACLAHLVRSEGRAKQASFGIAMGGILNMILDPIFIFLLRQGVAGAAIATMLSNLTAVVYFLRLLYQNRQTSVIRFSPRYYTLGQQIPREIILVGLPSFLLILMGNVSNITLNKLVVSYSNQAVAGMGIAKRIGTLSFAIANGMSQGVLPLVGYNFAAKNYDRMRTAIKTAFLYSFSVAAVTAVLIFIGAVPVARFFIDDPETVAFGQHFLRIICITTPAIAVTVMIISLFQATGQKTRPLILSFLRKGGLDVPLMLLLNAFLGLNGIPWATPISDCLAMLIAIALFLPYWKQLKKSM